MSVWRLGARLARHRPVLFAAGFVMWVTWWSTPVAAGLVLQRLFDAVSGQAPVGLGVGTLAVLFLAVEAARTGLFFAALRTWARWWTSVGALMRMNLLEAQLSSGGDRAGPTTDDPGGAVTVFRDDVDDFVIWVDTWLDATGTALFAVAALAIMVRIDAVVTVAVVVPLAAVMAVNRLLTPRIRRYRRADREATQRVTGFLGELFASTLAVKVAGAETHAVDRLRDLNLRRRRTALRDRLLTDTLDAANTSVIDVGVGLVLLLAAGSMRAGSFTVGDLALFVTYMGWLVGFPRWVGLLLARHRHAQVASQRMGGMHPADRPDGFVDRRRLRLDGGSEPPPPRPHRPGRKPAVVDVRGLGYRYPDGGAGIEAVDLHLPAGSFTVVTGPVGSGKSTLLRALLGLLAPVDGEVLYDGVPVTDLAAHFTPPRSAYVTQVPRLFTDTLRDNLTLGVDVDEGTLSAALRTAVFEEDLAEMPDGLDTLVGSRGVRLSGGQVQRAAAARALATVPELLVVDDLSSALDVATERALWDRLLDGRRCTILAVSHRAATLARADQVVHLERGRMRHA